MAAFELLPVPLYIHARFPCITCDKHLVKQVHVPWARSASGFTLLMEAVLLTMLQQMPVSHVAKQVGEHDTRLWRLITLYVEQALAKQDFSTVDAIGFDEYSHKGQQYTKTESRTGGIKGIKKIRIELSTMCNMRMVDV